MSKHQQDSFEEGCIYHVYNRVVTGEKLFKTDEDYQNFLKKYEKYFGAYFETYAFCLMPNHFHFLVKVKKMKPHFLVKENTNAAKKLLEKTITTDEFLSNQASRMFSSVAISYNNRQEIKRVGPLFKQGLKRVAQNTDSHILHQVCYIHHNPIHHKMTINYTDWVYSSYNAYLADKPSKIVRQPIIKLFGGHDNFLKIHQDFKVTKKNNLFDESI